MQNRTLAATGTVLVLLVCVFILGLHTGKFDFSTSEILKALAGQKVPDAYIITKLRLPRLLLAFCSGGILALSGIFMQALIRNPLADPYIMGLTSGAGFGVNLIILGIIPLAGISSLTYPLAAFLGGGISLILVSLLGFRSFFEDNAKLLIAGVAVSAIFTALTGLLIYVFADANQISRILFWTFGSFGKANWESVHVSAIALFLGILGGLAWSRKLDILILGDEQASTLGMPVPQTKFLLLLFTSLIVGCAVAFTGPIGFVGMMIPHFCRAINGSSHRPNIVFCAILGGTYLCACDIIARWILPPAGLPIGIITAILGVPFFLYILYSRKSYL